MSHWTPIKSEVVVYTTVAEAYSGSIDDVGKFVMKLKDDLKLGTDGFPKYLVIGGDQQTYAHMSNLKIKYPGHYDWVYTVPGDWHVMKNSAEVLKHILQDGGYASFSRKCGHKGDIAQWKDIQNVLVALCEATMKCAIIKNCNLNNLNVPGITDDKIPDEFWTWIKTYQENDTHTELSRFWSQIVMYLHAYVGFISPYVLVIGSFETLV